MPIKSSRTETNRKVVRRYFEEGWNQGRLEVFDDVSAPDYINHSPGISDPAPGPEGLKPIVAAMREAFPDLRYEIEDMIVTEDKGAIRSTMYRTHRGDLFGIAPTGKRVTVSQFQIEWLVDGKIVEHWRQTDDLGMMCQLGQIP